MLPSFFIALMYGDGDAAAFVYVILILAAVGFAIVRFVKPDDTEMYTREGLAVAGLCWLFMSLFGGLPLVFCGACGFWDAFFEITSGFTTTGATIFADVEALPRGILFWRSFTHWIGGMGVLVFTTALLPSIGGKGAHLARAESPGPTFSKLLPKLGDSAKVLYLIYAVMTILETVALIIAGMPAFDSVIHAFGTAGTGGFSNKNLSLGAYNNVSVEIIVSVFMLLFGVNFTVYFKLAARDFKGAFRHEETRVFIALAVISIVLVSLNLISVYGDFFTSLRYAAFQVPTVMSTTGYSSADFDLWPAFSKVYMLVLMLFGSCAGSTAGGLKISRVILLFKMAGREVHRAFQPRKVHVIKLEGKSVPEDTLSQIGIFFFAYICLLLAGTAAVSLGGSDTTTSFTASLACISNIGPGLAAVGPMRNFGSLADPIKVVLSFLMLAGRLELFPMLILFHPAAWKRV